MPLLSSLLFGLVASLDAFLVGMTYGIRNVRIQFRQNLLISMITLLGTCLSVLLGNWLLPLLPAYLARVAGSSILMLMGLYYLFKSMIDNLQKYRKTESFCDFHVNETSIPTSSDGTVYIIQTSASDTAESPSLTLREACLLGSTLSLNNMGIGLGASITGLSLLSTSVVTLLFSIAFLMAGNRLGCCRLLQLTKKAADPVSGLLLIVLGICQLVI